jgi:hypothetical protein
MWTRRKVEVAANECAGASAGVLAGEEEEEGGRKYELALEDAR